MRNNANPIGRPVNITQTGVIMQPLFLNATTRLPELRALSDDFPMFPAAETVRHQSSVPGLLPEPATSWRTVSRDGMNIVNLLFASPTTDGNVARIRITFWLRVELLHLPDEDSRPPDMFIPISRIYDITFGETTDPTLVPAITRSAANDYDWADTIVQVVSEPVDDEIFNPTGTNGVSVGRLRLFTRGADYVTIEAGGTTAGVVGTPVTNLQIFYGFE